MSALRPVCLLVGVVVAFVSAARAAEQPVQVRPPREPVAIDSRLELFVDDFLIDKLVGGARQKLHQPAPREVVLVADKPWEGNTSAYFTVFKDGERYRMYYRGSHFDEKEKKSTPR